LEVGEAAEGLLDTSPTLAAMDVSIAENAIAAMNVYSVSLSMSLWILDDTAYLN
jgi:hypothetical protein